MVKIFTTVSFTIFILFLTINLYKFVMNSNNTPCTFFKIVIGWLFVYGWYLSISLTFYLSIALSIYLSHFLSIYRTFYLSISLSIYLSQFDHTKVLLHLTTETVKLWNFGILPFFFLAPSFMKRLKFQNHHFLRYIFV